MALPYTYRPLESLSTIRLIKILPEKIDGCVACVMSHFGSSETPPYTSLSYCWGDPTPTGKIYIGNDPSSMHERPLHENLLRFVESMWSQCEFSTYFWTDSLCLDQENTQEKSHQVPRMGEIYEGAAEVLIWLGHEEETFKHMDIVSRYFQSLRSCYMWESYEHANMNLRHEPAISAASLSKVQYWGRTWIVQEVVLARRPVLASREIRLDFEDYSHFFKYFQGMNIRYDWKAEEIFHLRRYGGRRPLWSLLAVLKIDRQCTRSIDKVYSLLGLTTDNVDGTHVSELLEVNYDKTPVQVYWDTIFECKPGVGSYSVDPRQILEILRSLIQGHGRGSTYGSLKHYVRSLQSLYETPERKLLSSLTALQVCDAVSIFITKHKLQPRKWQAARSSLVAWTRGLNISHAQYSAFVGLAISAGETGQNGEEVGRTWLTMIRWYIPTRKTRIHAPNDT